jgi:glutamyl-tRNA reductase
MLSNLNIIHRRKPEVFASEGSPVWTTCLRSLAFLPAEKLGDLLATDEIYHADRAYKFLLEIVCGLHSPILGETEVLGQFKAFAPNWVELRPEHGPLVQRLLSDAKGIRTKHLENLGIQSYGSWIRKNMRSPDIHILGAGQLVHEILPNLKKQARNIDIHVRNPWKVDDPVVHALDLRAFTGGALIVAAPVSAAFVQEWLGGKTPSQIFDLRDVATSDPIAGHVKNLNTEIFKLADIFTEIESNKKRLEPVIQAVHSEIQACADKITSSAIIRPNGWDDLCA